MKIVRPLTCTHSVKFWDLKKPTNSSKGIGLPGTLIADADYIPISFIYLFSLIDNSQLIATFIRVTEEIIEEMAQSGAVNSLRLPVGDFMYVPYGPYGKCIDIAY